MTTTLAGMNLEATHETGSRHIPTSHCILAAASQSPFVGKCCCLNDGNVRARGPDLTRSLAVPTPPEDVLAGLDGLWDNNVIFYRVSALCEVSDCLACGCIVTSKKFAAVSKKYN